MQMNEHGAAPKCSLNSASLVSRRPCFKLANAIRGKSFKYVVLVNGLLQIGKRNPLDIACCDCVHQCRYHLVMLFRVGVFKSQSVKRVVIVHFIFGAVTFGMASMRGLGVGQFHR